jgi:formyl-CoA transferase
MLEHPQTVARNMVVETDHPTAGRVRSLGSAVKMSGTGHRSQSDAGSSGGTPSPAPLLGQHTREVLGDAGVSDERIDVLVTQGVLVSSDPRTAL